MKRKTLLLVVVLLILGIGVAGYFVMNRYKGNPASQDSQNNSKSKTGIKGSVLLGPACPTQDSLRGSRNAACSDQPYQTRLVVTTSDQAQVIKEFSSNDKGVFTVEVPPGEYAIRSAAAADVKPYCSSGTLKVTDNTIIETIVYCETGLR